PHLARPPTPPAAGRPPCVGLVPRRGYHSPSPTPPRSDRGYAPARATMRAVAAHLVAAAAGGRPGPSSRPTAHPGLAAARQAPLPAHPPRCGGPPTLGGGR